MNVSEFAGFPKSRNTLKSEVFPGILSESDTMEDLLDRVLTRNDYQAFQILFGKMYKPLCSFTLKFVQSREVAEEVVSDVFYNIWKNRARITVTSHRSYLYTAVRNRALDYIRGRGKTLLCSIENAVHLPAENHTLLDKLENREAEYHLNESIKLLPRQCKIIFEMSRGEGMKYKDIASQLSISVKTVEAQMGRALKQLRGVREAIFN